MLRQDPICDTENHVRDNNDPIRNMLHDAFGELRHSRRDEPLGENMTADAKTFYDLLKDGEEPLYDGCAKFTKLSFLVRMYHIKCLYGISAEAMNMFFELFSEAFEFAKISKSFYEAKKVIKNLSLTYAKIDMFPNDCMLYWAEDENKEECNKCHTSRWKNEKSQNDKGATSTRKKRKKQSAKVLRYFPLIPRLKRLFMSSKTSEDMIWHARDCETDNMIRHPRDSKA